MFAGLAPRAGHAHADWRRRGSFVVEEEAVALHSASCHSFAMAVGLAKKGPARPVGCGMAAAAPQLRPGHLLLAVVCALSHHVGAEYCPVERNDYNAGDLDCGTDPTKCNTQVTRVLASAISPATPRAVVEQQMLPELVHQHDVVREETSVCTARWHRPAQTSMPCVSPCAHYFLPRDGCFPTDRPRHDYPVVGPSAASSPSPTAPSSPIRASAVRCAPPRPGAAAGPSRLTCRGSIAQSAT